MDRRAIQSMHTGEFNNIDCKRNSFHCRLKENDPILDRDCGLRDTGITEMRTPLLRNTSSHAFSRPRLCMSLYNTGDMVFQLPVSMPVSSRLSKSLGFLVVSAPHSSARRLTRDSRRERQSTHVLAYSTYSLYALVLPFDSHFLFLHVGECHIFRRI